MSLSISKDGVTNTVGFEGTKEELEVFIKTIEKIDNVVICIRYFRIR